MVVSNRSRQSPRFVVEYYSKYLRAWIDEKYTLEMTAKARVENLKLSGLKASYRPI